MFDIGMPEFAVIGLVVLIVIGPERLPKVMGQLGRWYRQLRTMSNDLLAEARQQWEEGMREVEEVTSTVNSAWQEATTSEPAANLPPPRLAQVNATLEQPATAAAAGPWALAAYHRNTSGEAEPYDASFPESPFSLPRRLPTGYDPAVDDAAGTGGPMLMGAAPTEDELAAMAYDLPEELPEAPVPVDGAEEIAPIASGTDDFLDRTQPAPAPAAPGTNGAHAADGAGRIDVTAVNGRVGAADDVEPAERERVIIELYLKGGITAPAAAGFLGVGESEFLDWVELARSMQRSSERAERA